MVNWDDIPDGEDFLNKAGKFVCQLMSAEQQDENSLRINWAVVHGGHRGARFTDFVGIASDGQAKRAKAVLARLDVDVTGTRGLDAVCIDLNKMAQQQFVCGVEVEAKPENSEGKIYHGPGYNGYRMLEEMPRNLTLHAVDAKAQAPAAAAAPASGGGGAVDGDDDDEFDF